MSTDKLRPIAKTTVVHRLTDETTEGTFFIDDEDRGYFQTDEGVMIGHDDLGTHYLIDMNPIAKALGFSRQDKRALARKEVKLRKKGKK